MKLGGGAPFRMNESLCKYNIYAVRNVFIVLTLYLGGGGKVGRRLSACERSHSRLLDSSNDH